MKRCRELPTGAPDAARALFVKPLHRFSASLVRTTTAQQLWGLAGPELCVMRGFCVMGRKSGTRPNVAKRKVLEQLARAPFSTAQRSTYSKNRLAIRSRGGRFWRRGADCRRCPANRDYLRRETD